MKVTVIGETNLDIRVVPKETASKGCTPSNIHFCAGGVARNIAHYLCHMHHQVELASLFADDDFALRLMNECRSDGISLTLSNQMKGYKSPIFLSVNEEIGEAKASFSDMEINSLMDEEWISSKMDALNTSDVVVADTLLSAQGLSYLFCHCNKPLFIDTVSPLKALRLAEAIKISAPSNLFVLKCNHGEAVALTGTDDPNKAIRLLVEMGVSHVYLTLGKNGVIYGSSQLVKHFSAPSTHVVNVIGSGDAFLAGVVDAFSKQIVGEKAVAYGLEAAKRVLEGME